MARCACWTSSAPNSPGRSEGRPGLRPALLPFRGLLHSGPANRWAGIHDTF